MFKTNSMYQFNWTTDQSLAFLKSVKENIFKVFNFNSNLPKHVLIHYSPKGTLLRRVFENYFGRLELTWQTFWDSAIFKKSSRCVLNFKRQLTGRTVPPYKVHGRDVQWTMWCANMPRYVKLRVIHKRRRNISGGRGVSNFDLARY